MRSIATTTRALARLTVQSTQSATRTITTSSKCARPATTQQSTATPPPFPSSDAAPAYQPSNRRTRHPTTNVVQHSLTRVGKARHLLAWNWLSREDAGSLVVALESDNAEQSLPGWLNTEYETARAFRSVRSRRWLPSRLPEDMDEAASSSSSPTSVSQWLHERIMQRREDDADFAILPLEDQEDFILKDVWKSIDAEARKNASLECRFTCLRKLGWRAGYSAGFPLAADSPQAQRRRELVARTSNPEDVAALAELNEFDEEQAWQDWISMSSAEREAAERDAWEQRDRSTLFIDDSPYSTVLDSTMPRWFAEPQRAGNLVFLPNILIKLVRNTTPAGKPYDPWKATFRVPLNVHKHTVKSYLLAVYGLRTTWIRSMIYRSPLTGTNYGQQIATGKGRTFKKIEVGLLEPFIWPEIPAAKRKEIFGGAFLEQQRAAATLKAKGIRRWRGKKIAPSAQRLEAQRLREERLQRDQAGEGELVAFDPEDNKAATTPRLSPNPNNTMQTKKHGSILKLIGDKRKQRQRQIDEKAAALRQEAEAASKTGEQA